MKDLRKPKHEETEKQLEERMAKTMDSLVKGIPKKESE